MVGDDGESGLVGPQGEGAVGSETTWSSGAHAIAAIGPACTSLVAELVGSTGLPLEDAALKDLQRSLSDTFADAQAAKVLRAIFDAVHAGRPVDLATLRRWLRAHPNDSESVIECLPSRLLQE